MADAVLAAGEAHDLVGGDGVHVKAALVVAADSLQHLGQVAQAVLPVFVVLRGIDERLLQVVCRCKIPVSYTHLDVYKRQEQRHVFAFGNRNALVHRMGKAGVPGVLN